MSPDTAMDQLILPQLLRAAGQPFATIPLTQLSVVGLTRRDTADSAAITSVMRNLGASPYLENPELVEIKAVAAPDKSGSRVNEFNMNISIKRAQPEDGRVDAAEFGKAQPDKGSQADQQGSRSRGGDYGFAHRGAYS